MEIGIISNVKKGEEIFVNSKGVEFVDIDPAAINCFTFDNKQLRLIGINKDLFRLTEKSFKELKRELTKKGIIYKFDNSRKTLG